MRRQTLILNVILLAAAAGLSWNLQAAWKQGARRQAALAPQASAVLPAAGLPAAQPPASGVEVIVASNLFFSDRNNEMPRAVEKKPAPPEPILVGTLNLGGSKKVALMLEASQPTAMPRQVKEGDDFGGYKVAEIGDNQVTVDWEGTKKKVDVSSAPRPVAAPTASFSGAPSGGGSQVTSTANTPSVTSLGAAPQPPGPAKAIAGQQGPSDEVMPGTTNRKVFPGDSTPAGTVINGFIKVERASPFGKESWWQKVDPTPNERKQ